MLPMLTLLLTVACAPIGSPPPPPAPPVSQSTEFAPRNGDEQAEAAACPARGGHLARIGKLQALRCIVTYPDAGKACTDGAQCLGQRCVGDFEDAAAPSPATVRGLTMQAFDVVIVGAGAAGMMCAIEAGRRGRSVLILDHARAPGEKIRISGGGRCNFTNIHAGPQAFLSRTRGSAISALRRYTPHDFIAAVDRAASPGMRRPSASCSATARAKQIITMLTDDMAGGGRGAALQTSASSGSTARARASRLTLSDGDQVRCARWWSPPAASRSPRWARPAGPTTRPAVRPAPSPRPGRPWCP
jgi:hypothetical protein